MKKWIICFLLAGFGLCTYAQTNSNNDQVTKVTKVKTKTKTTGDAANAATVHNTTPQSIMADTTKHVAHKSTSGAHKKMHSTAMHKKTTAGIHKKSSAVAYHKHHYHKAGMGSTMTSSSSNAAKTNENSNTATETNTMTKTKIKTSDGKETKHKTVRSSSSNQ